MRKTVRVKASVEAAFRLFTAGINGWWPLATHSVCEEEDASCAVEGRVGGRFFERARDGKEHVWGTVTAWEPPVRVAFTWHPGRAAAGAQSVEVRFSDAGSGVTLVELTHTGWEKLGAQAVSVRERYETGWDFVLGEYFAKAV